MDKNHIGAIEGFVLFQLSLIFAKIFGFIDWMWIFVLTPTIVCVTVLAVAGIVFYKVSKEVFTKFILYLKNRKGKVK